MENDVIDDDLERPSEVISATGNFSTADISKNTAWITNAVIKMKGSHARATGSTVCSN